MEHDPTSITDRFQMPVPAAGWYLDRVDYCFEAVGGTLSAQITGNGVAIATATPVAPTGYGTTDTGQLTGLGELSTGSPPYDIRFTTGSTIYRGAFVLHYRPIN